MKKYLQFTVLAFLCLIVPVQASKYFTDFVAEDGKIQMRERTASPSMVTNYGFVYPKTDGRLYFLNDSGTEYDVLLGGSADLDQLLDVVITSPATNDMIQYDGSQWVNVPFSGGISAWVTATDYEIGDVVHINAKIYLAETNHTSGVFLTDLGNGDWSELSASPFNQSLNTSDSVEFAGLTLTGFSGFLKATAGVISTALVDLAADVTGMLPITNLADGTANQLIGANAAGNANEFKTISGTSNQVSVTHGAGTITLATPQDIATGSIPTFSNQTLSSRTAGRFSLFDTGGIFSDSSAFTWSGSTMTVAGQFNAGNLSLGGNTFSSTDVDGDLVLDPNGTGGVLFNDLTASRPLKLDANKEATATQIDLSSSNDITGVLALANGGTNKALTAAAGGIVYTDADSMEVLGAGTSGHALVSGGSGAPTWFSPSNARVIFSTSGALSADPGFTYNSTTDVSTMGAVRANSTSQASIPCNPVTTAQRVAMSASAGWCVYDTDLKTQLVYDGTNWNIQGIQPNSTGWEAYTPTTQGIGTPTTDCYSRYDGPDKLISCLITVGTPTASELQVGIGGSDTIGTAVNSVGARGSWFYGNTVTAHGGAIVFSAGQSYVKFGPPGTFGDSSVLPTDPQNGNGIFTVGQVFSFHVRVPVANRAASLGAYSIPSSGSAQIKWTNVTNCNPTTTSASFVDLADSDCTYAAASKIGPTATPTDAGEFALKRSTAVAAGKYRLTVAGVLYASYTNTTQCAFQLTDGTNIVGPVFMEATASNIASVGGIPPTIVTYSAATTPEWRLQAMRVSGTGSCGVFASSANTSLAISMVPEEEVITGTFKDVVQSPSTPNGSPKICSFRINGSTDAASFVVGNCLNSTTCTNASGTRATCTWATSYWTQAPNCSCTQDSGANTNHCRLDSVDTTDLDMQGVTDGGLAGDLTAHIVCHGY